MDHAKQGVQGVTNLMPKTLVSLLTDLLNLEQTDTHSVCFNGTSAFADP